MIQTQLSEKQEAQIAKLHSEGVPIATLVKKYHIGRNRIFNILKKYNVEYVPKEGVGRRKGESFILSKEDDLNIEKAYKAGKSIDSISIKYYCAPDTIRRSLERSGVKLRGHYTALSKNDYLEIIDMYNSNVKLSAIAKKKHISRKRITMIINGEEEF